MRGRSLLMAGVLFGLGLGGFFDGIVFHQILQWHHMVSVRYPATSVENPALIYLAKQTICPQPVEP